MSLKPKSTTGVIASIVGATGDGGAALNAQIGGVIGQNAVENNYYLTENVLAKTPKEVRNIYEVLKDKVNKECSNGRIQECRQDIERVIAFAQDSRFAKNYKNLQIESMQFLSDNPKLLADYLTTQYEKLNREDKSILHRYITPGAEIVGGASGIVISVKGGAATCAQSFGLTCGAAAIGVASSSDHLITGLNNFGKKASEQRPTITVQGLKQLGLSEQAANYVQLAVDTLSVGKVGETIPKNSLNNQISRITIQNVTGENYLYFKNQPISWSVYNSKGTGLNYQIYQRVDIDWNKVRTAGDKKFIGKTNAEAAQKGLAPQLSDGNFATLHHLGQKSTGPLVEANTRYHGVGKSGQQILHGQYGVNKPHPILQPDRKKFNVDNREYWKWRVNNR